MRVVARERILVVDDETAIRELVGSYLRDEGFVVEEAPDGEAALERFRSLSADLVVLDVRLPGIDGYDVLRELRRSSTVYVIMLTARGEETDRLVGLELGADDYMTKPFDERELLARVRTVLRRTASVHETTQPAHATAARFEGWTLDLIAHELIDPQGRPIHLTSNQFQVLVCLVTRANRVLSRGEILELVSGRDWTPMDRSIDVLIGKLRRKVEPDARFPTLIKTIRGVGYKFTARVEYDGQET